MQKLCVDGRFFVGCNYWASHAGTNMWHDWDAAAVEADFARLAKDQITTLRVFPLWPDFQPLKQLCASAGSLREMRMDTPGEPLFPDTPEGIAGVDPVMVGRFQIFCDLAEKYGLRLIVGLLTGWMSGRLYVPEALERRNVLTDPMAIRWERKFVHYMVNRFKEHPAIVAWDLGNECNCMGSVADAEEAGNWAETITDAIRVADPSRPVVSGMHGLNPAGCWRPKDHGQTVDVLTTHPYPIFTPHCDTDPLSAVKSPMHAAAESLYYAGLGGKPCFAEEAGTLGPMIASEAVAADYVRCAMATLWSQNCYGFLWWCANEQSLLTHAPYDWNSVERELGLYRLDGSPKPVLETVRDFSNYLWQVGPLPQRLTDAVCLISQGQDSWAAAYGSFLLARQAGLDITYRWVEDPLPDAKVYLLPSLCGDSSLSRHALAALLEKVRNGATLYLSLDTALLSPFTDFTGLEVQTRCRAAAPDTVNLFGCREKFSLQAGFSLEMRATTAQILAENRQGDPVFAVNAYGKGKVYTLAYPLEKLAATTPGILSGAHSQALHEFYRTMALQNPEKLALGGNPNVGISEHIREDGTHLLVVINYAPAEEKITCRLPGTWHFKSTVGPENGCTAKASADSFTLTLPAHRFVTVSIGK